MKILPPTTLKQVTEHAHIFRPKDVPTFRCHKESFLLFQRLTIIIISEISYAV